MIIEPFRIQGTIPPTTSEVEGDMDLFHDSSVLICRAIYIAHKDRLGEGSGLKLVFLYKTLVYEHAGCSRIQEHGCGDRCKGSEGGELDLDVEGAGGVLQQDIDCRWGNCHKGFGEVAYMGSLNFSGCGFSLV